MSIVSARIMNFAEVPTTQRGLGLWFSPDDFARLVSATLRLEQPGHHIVWGVSRNTRGVVSLEAGERMGFSPQDDAESFADVVATGGTEYELLAGPFVDDAHPMGEAWSIRRPTEHHDHPQHAQHDRPSTDARDDEGRMK
jgi:uronate dehydrogenase